MTKQVYQSHSMKKDLNERTAYEAMFLFLLDYYNKTKSDDIGSLLGSMSLLESGHTADPAVWEDWLYVLENLEKNHTDTILDIK